MNGNFRTENTKPKIKNSMNRFKKKLANRRKKIKHEKMENTTEQET